MNKYFLFSVLRQMRKPIITIILYYAIAVTGLYLIPGVDNNGDPHQMGLFHSLYVIVYTSTTIGFGELPYAWTDNQRLWVLISAVTGVVLWVYAMGKVISLSQNKVFKDKIDEYRFNSSVESIKTPFFIIIGYGVTGKKILNLLHSHDMSVVIIDQDPKAFERIDSLTHKRNIPFLIANGSNLENLKMAGIDSPLCKGVMVMSGSEESNIQAAISIKLINPNIQLLVRAEMNQNINNLMSFGTDHIVSASRIFAKELFLLLNREEEYNLRQKLNSEIQKFKYTKDIPNGKWIICGYNEVTKKIINHLMDKDIDFKLITEKKIEGKLLKSHVIQGVGVSKNNLRNAGCDNADVIYAASRDDFDNLSTIITAKELNKNIYTIATQNKSYRKELFDNAKIDLVFQPQYKIAAKVHSLITEPFLNVFYNEIENLEKNQIQKIELNLNQDNIETWHFRMNSQKCFFSEIVKNKLYIKNLIPVGHNITVLMVQNEDGCIILEPKLNYKIKENDILLFAGNNKSFVRHQLLMYNKIIYQEYQYRKEKGIHNG